MTNVQKTVKGLACCAHIVPQCGDCPYEPLRRKHFRGEGPSCHSFLASDAFTLLRAQSIRESLIVPLCCESCRSHGEDGKCGDRRSVHYGDVTAKDIYCKYWEE